MRNKRSRIVDAIVGAGLVIIGAGTLLAAWSTAPVGAALIAVIVGGLGLEAIVSAILNRASILSRIGPLP